MAMNDLGVSFAPTNEQAATARNRGALEGVPQAMKILSLRLPRMIGQRAPAPSQLLTAPGAQGMDPFLSAVMATLVQAINPAEAAVAAQPAGMFPAMPPPAAVAPPPNAMALPMPFGGGIPNTNAGPNPPFLGHQQPQLPQELTQDGPPPQAGPPPPMPAPVPPPAVPVAQGASPDLAQLFESFLAPQPDVASAPEPAPLPAPEPEPVPEPEPAYTPRLVFQPDEPTFRVPRELMDDAPEEGFVGHFPRRRQRA